MNNLLLLIIRFLLLGLLNLNKAERIISVLEQKNVVSQLKLSDDELIFAHIIYRHGDANIGTVFPNDPFKDEIHWSGGYGQLTNEGKKQHYILGQFFRRRYNTLLGDKYSTNKVYIQSTDVDRTLMSAQANLAGLFFPTKDEIWDEKILWQPIPVHTMPNDMDFILFVGKDCPKFNIHFEKYAKSSKEIQRIYSEYEELFSYWSQMCGSPIKTIVDVYKLYKTLEIERVHNKPLSDWALKAIEPNGTMKYIAAFYHKMYADTPELARIESGFLLREILDRFTQKIHSTLQPDRSLWFYSGHSITISFMLHSLGLFELHIPPHASSIHFELYETGDKKHYLQIFYRKSREEYPKALSIPGCGPKCPLDQFYALYKNIIPNDFDSECQIPAHTVKSKGIDTDPNGDSLAKIL